MGFQTIIVLKEFIQFLGFTRGFSQIRANLGLFGPKKHQISLLLVRTSNLTTCRIFQAAQPVFDFFLFGSRNQKKIHFQSQKFSKKNLQKKTTTTKKSKFFFHFFFGTFLTVFRLEPVLSLCGGQILFVCCLGRS